MLMKRSLTSRKGDNGKVLVVGGSELYHGAPILAGLGAEKSGADLVYLMVPSNQQHLARSFSLNLIVESFSGDYLRGRDVQKVLDWSEKTDVMVLGNGLGERPQTQRALRKILQKSSCSLVGDAAALEPFVAVADKLNNTERQIVLTPHPGELHKMGLENDIASLKRATKDWGVTLVLKGPEDLIIGPDGKTAANTSGHPIMTKGGTGDVLAGLIGGLMAQGLSGFDAAKQACHDWGKVGEYVFKQQGLETTVAELVQSIPS